MTTTRTITVTKRDGTTKSVETPYTDEQVLARLEALVTPPPTMGGRRMGTAHRLARSGFACDLVDKGRRYGLSEKQAAWVHILVVEAETPREAPAPVATVTGLRGMIDLAGGTLKFPKVNVTTESGQRIRLSRAGENSRTPGVIHVTDGKPYGESTYFGKIDLEGNLLPSDSMTPEVADFLQALNDDPEAVATAYGQRTGSCCFCSRELTDGRSVAVGYGPVCAEHYGLPWGDERASSTIEVSPQDAVPHDDPEGDAIRSEIAAVKADYIAEMEEEVQA